MLARAIKWMVRVERIALEADIAAIAAEFDWLLRRLVAEIARVCSSPVTNAARSPLCGTRQAGP